MTDATKKSAAKKKDEAPAKAPVKAAPKVAAKESTAKESAAKEAPAKAAASKEAHEAPAKKAAPKKAAAEDKAVEHKADDKAADDKEAGKGVKGKGTSTKGPTKSAPGSKEAPKAKPDKQPASAFSKPLTPSKELSAILGSPDALPRTAVVSKVWEYIKQHKLQNESNKREILADDKLKTIFGKDKVSMFEMNKYFNAHLKS